MNSFKNLLGIVLLTTTFALFADQSQAGTLHSAVEDCCLKLCKYLKSKGETQIAIGQFVGPPQIASTSGPGIVKVFHEHFDKNGIAVVTRANIGLKGEYVLTKMPNEGVAVKIKGSLVDPFGDVLTDFTLDGDHDYKPDHPEYVAPGHIEKVVDDHKDIASLLGATTEIYAEDKEVDRNRDLKKQVLHPDLYVEGTRCSPSKKSPYRIEVLVHGHPVPIDVTDGLGFVKIALDEIYSVKIYNHSEYDAAIYLSIDGLNVFTFSNRRKKDGSPKYSFYIVPAHKVIELKGWHRDNEVVNSFQVMKYADSAAASINHQQNLGTITAVFAAAWPKGGPRPHDEDFTSKGAGNATGFGPPVAQVVKEVQREVGRMRASISLRYTK